MDNFLNEENQVTIKVISPTPIPHVNNVFYWPLESKKVDLFESHSLRRKTKLVKPWQESYVRQKALADKKTECGLFR
jgi:hypothetical protein